MTTSGADILSQRLASLRGAYAAELPERVRIIEDAAASLLSGDAEGLGSLYHLVHRLTGSAAVYGFAQVSRASAALEDFLLSQWTGTAQPAGDSAAPLTQLVAAVKQELAAAGIVPQEARRDGG
jgi:HPt (histidine-containing phosphotransfer) domain-containing protein